MERSADRFFLQRGQILHVHAGQAASIFVASGSLSLAQAPQWLGEQLLTPCIALSEGQFHPLDAGWIRLTALAPAEIVALPRRHRLPAWPGFPRRLFPALSDWRGRLTGRRA